jgi:hypothetical protein
MKEYRDPRSRTHTEYEPTKTQQLVQYTAIACALRAGRRDIRWLQLAADGKVRWRYARVAAAAALS